MIGKLFAPLAMKVAGGACAFLLVAVITLSILLNVRTGQRDRARERVVAEQVAHAQTITNYRQAQAEAARLDAERVARVEREQQEINRVSSQNYEARVAELRARLERLRSAAGAAGSAGRDLAVPSLPDTPGGADATTGGAGLPPAGDDLEWRAIATKQAIQLDELIGWVSDQVSVTAGE